MQSRDPETSLSQTSNLSNVNPHLRAAVRKMVLVVNTPVARRRLTRELRETPRPFKLEIGGLTARDGWVVTNVSAVTKLFLDATSRWPVEDGAISHVYADNVIEHIPLDGVREMFREAHRCLRPGGVIRLVTPDMRKHIELYLRGQESVDGEVANTYRAIGVRIDHPIDLVRIPIAEFKHYEGTAWDFASLEAELLRAGFHSVTEHPAGESGEAALNNLDIRTNEGGAQMSVEAVK
jgi:hypothetical protein